MNMSRSSQRNDSTGSESGWTMYLDESSISSYQHPQRNTAGNSQDGYQFRAEDDEEEEEEEEDVDLSMVSDASSGPPHDLHEDEDEDHEYCRKSEKESKKLGKKKKKMMMMMMSKQMCQHNQSLDDTASSPPIHNLSSQKQKGIKGSDEHGTASNSRKSKGKSTSVGQSYSRSSVK